MNYVEKVIMSCQTHEQLDSCNEWIKRNLRIYDNYDSFGSFAIETDLRTLIMNMKDYLNKKGNVK